MKWRIMLMLSFVLLSVGNAHSQSACKWFTDGSAAALLGGPVTVSAKSLPSGEGSCTYSLQQVTTLYLLEISVANSAHGSCPQGSQKLAGIGNEAFVCRFDRLPHEIVEEVNSRVRNMYFTVSLTIRGTSTSVMSPGKRQDVVQQVAEQVAGNLN
jgi:hypothetical protein